jgi:hypothetical protein
MCSKNTQSIGLLTPTRASDTVRPAEYVHYTKDEDYVELYFPQLAHESWEC